MEIIGHRGARGLWPENTLEGFSKALEGGVVSFELDVHTTKDNFVVVHHDPTLTTGESLQSLTYKELPSFIPRLEEVLDLCLGKARVTIEVKISDITTTAYFFVELISKILTPCDYVVISSFDWDVVRAVHALMPNIPTAALSEGEIGMYTIQGAWELEANIWSPEYIHLEESHVSYAHSLGLQVVPYTVNDPEDIKRLQKMGVDGIITDFPLNKLGV